SREWTPELEAEQKAEMLKMREFTIEEVEEHLKNGDKFVLRMLSCGDPDKKIKFTDLVKGAIEIPENDKDEVLLKSDGIPTYHFAHAIDDHLMGTTHVVRGEEWLPSLSRHIMLFDYLGFKLPKYMHIAQIMHLDENGNKKKLSKRDMGANVEDYRRMGYTNECVSEYVMTLLNSNFEEWHAQNSDKKTTDFPFSIKKMSTSGCLLDFDKLTDVSKNVLSKMTADEIYAKVADWANEFDSEFGELLSADPEYAKKIFAIGRGGKKPRKDFATLADVKPFIGFFYDKYFKIEDEYPEKFDKADIKTVLEKFIETYDPADDMNTWFSKIQNIGTELGYTPDMKAYKANPDQFKGNVGDVSMFIRIAVTGKMNSPDMYAVMQIIGEDKVKARISDMLKTL
ncbi:MAG: glutamate--tRNA ligase, partial [Ruminococcaceae bacterium]|nr:glutamate--tRNA ligase [Oscillospiraceae bacterium]